MWRWWVGQLSDQSRSLCQKTGNSSLLKVEELESGVEMVDGIERERNAIE